MIAMGVVEMPIDQVVDVITVGHRFVAATWTMYMLRSVAAAVMSRRAVVRVRVTDGNYMFMNRPICVDMVQVSVVQIVDMIAVLYARMFTVGPMFMVVFVLVASHWSIFPSRELNVVCFMVMPCTKLRWISVPWRA